MQQNAVEQAMSEGAPITCATCYHFHRGNGYCGKSDCGGPTAGRDFPCYDGPIPREKFVERCLVCGSSSVSYHIVMKAEQVRLSLCKTHKTVFNHVGNPNSKLKVPVSLIAIV